MLQFFKVWCYWEHLGEHIENLGTSWEPWSKHIENLGNPMRTLWEHIIKHPFPLPPPPPQFAYEGGGSWLYLLFCLWSGTGSDRLVKREPMVKKTAWWVLSQLHEEQLLGTQWTQKKKLSRNDHWERNEPKKKALEKWSLGTQWTPKKSSWEMIIGNAMNPKKKLSRNDHWERNEPKKKLSRNDHWERNEPKKSFWEMIIGNAMNQKGLLMSSII
jgi:hypothetical protein